MTSTKSTSRGMTATDWAAERARFANRHTAPAIEGDIASTYRDRAAATAERTAMQDAILADPDDFLALGDPTRLFLRDLERKQSETRAELARIDQAERDRRH